MIDNFESRIEKLILFLRDRDVTFLGGAGVSTGSGIPDFRSSNGLYNNVESEFSKYQPEYLLSHGCYSHKPKIFYSYYRKFLDVRNYEPCTVHNVLAKLEEMGMVKGIITQNIDTLHEKAGSKNVLKIHGTIATNHCVRCKKKYSANWFFDNDELIPRCECGGQVRPDVVLYDENYPDGVYEKSCELLSETKCLIVAGTSLTVNTAKYLIDAYLQLDGERYLVIMNREETDYDDGADIVFHEDMNKVFEKVNDLL